MSYLEINGLVIFIKTKEKPKETPITTIIGCCIDNSSLDAILKSIIKRQIPFLIGGPLLEALWHTIMVFYLLL